MRALVIKVILIIILFLFVLFLVETKEKPEVKEETLKKSEVKKKEVHYVEVMVNGAAQLVELETYLIGVVASEMPYTFEEEALKAQSVAARTFVMQRNLKVDNTTSSQVYKSEQELKEIFADDYDTMYQKIKSVVSATESEVLKYQGGYISALFYSCNNGKTNDSSWYYSSEVPYLKSVESPWDLNYEACKQAKELSVNDVLSKLGVTYINASNYEYYENGYVKRVVIGGKYFSGRQVREKLGLRSNCFSFVEQGSSVIVNTQGFGHGVGMSQYGADGMAKEKKTYREILQHYYQGVSIEKIQ